MNGEASNDKVTKSQTVGSKKKVVKNKGIRTKKDARTQTLLPQGERTEKKEGG